ncbi:MAG: glycoside hydrolase family 127 protein [Bacteroidaceae bacterium]|nr:glycoside hydrolase family 127 protein [Bacteroidaceae bacterium]
MKSVTTFLFSIVAVIALDSCLADAKEEKIVYPSPNQVEITDRIWSTFLERTRDITIPDVLDKFEGRHIDQVSKDDNNFWSPDRGRVNDETSQKRSHNTLRNFELVAEGHVADGGHFGFPWFDGLIYETITGISDYLLQFPDAAMEARLDEYIRRIEAAQKADPNGYINTYTTLQENDHRWGENGGNLRWQHDVYNSGCLVEAGVHYYKATGKTQLLEVATRLANYMYDYMAGANHNVVPGHALPEDALIQLYHLYKSEPTLAEKLSVPVKPENYLRLAEFWIEQRGHTEGRRPLEAYAQDAESVFDMQTIEGHAVRATLFATGVADAAIVNRNAKYIDAAHRLWDNMVGRRMFITGGVGAIHEDEKFGPDYFLPTDAYLETCAAIGAGLFSWRMNELTGDAKYIDVLERIIFNSIPTAVSMDGTNYTYQNPLNADKMNRWPWHDCPCCPPMLLKFTGMLPSMIYAVKGTDIYVNLFIGSKAKLELPGVGIVEVKQEVDWNTGKVNIQVNSPKPKKLRVLVRMPCWNEGDELPLGLYHSDLQSSENVDLKKGYKVFTGEQAKDIDLTFNTQPRIVCGDEHIEQLQDLCSLASGPFVYCAERIDNEAEWDSLKLSGREYVLDTNNPILGYTPIRSKDGAITAIPFCAIANRCKDTAYRVWAK